MSTPTHEHEYPYPRTRVRITTYMNREDRHNEQTYPATSGTFAQGFGQNWAKALVNFPNA